MIRWTGLAPWELEFPFTGSLTSTFLGVVVNLSSGRCYKTGLLHRNVQRFRGGLVFKAHRLLSLNSRLESNNEEEEARGSLTFPLKDCKKVFQVVPDF